MHSLTVATFLGKVEKNNLLGFELCECGNGTYFSLLRQSEKFFSVTLLYTIPQRTLF